MEILVCNGHIKRRICTDEIYYIESNNRKVILYLPQGNVEYYDKISKLEQELCKDFFRIHKGYLVNMKFVEGYTRSEVSLRNGDNLPISKYRYSDFVKGYQEYISCRKSQ